MQNTCAQNPEWLAQNGILYPDLLSTDANHITLMYVTATTITPFARGYGIKDEADVLCLRERLTKKIDEQIATAPAHIHTMFVSSENLTGNMGGPAATRVAEFLRPHFSDIQIVVYLRRQDQAILSMYGEFMRRGFNSDSFSEFLKAELGPKPRLSYLNYEHLLTGWVDAFGLENINVRLFDKDRFSGGTMLSDCMGTVLGRAEVDVSGFVPAQSANKSPSAPALEFLRRVNARIPFAYDGVANPLRAELTKKVNNLPTDPRPQISRAESAAILDHFASQNEWLKTRFFPTLEGPLFSDGPDLNDTGNTGEITLYDYEEFTRILLQ